MFTITEGKYRNHRQLRTLFPNRTKTNIQNSHQTQGILATKLRKPRLQSMLSPWSDCKEGKALQSLPVYPKLESFISQRPLAKCGPWQRSIMAWPHSAWRLWPHWMPFGFWKHQASICHYLPLSLPRDSLCLARTALPSSFPPLHTCLPHTDSSAFWSQGKPASSWNASSVTCTPTAHTPLPFSHEGTLCLPFIEPITMYYYYSFVCQFCVSPLLVCQLHGTRNCVCLVPLHPQARQSSHGCYCTFKDNLVTWKNAEDTLSYEKTIYKIISGISMKIPNFKIYKFTYVQNIIRKYIKELTRMVWLYFFCTDNLVTERKIIYSMITVGNQNHWIKEQKACCQDEE